MTNEVIETLEESGSWRTREVTYWAGRWENLRCQIPQFETVPFQVASDTPANPYMKSVIRLPRTKIEQSVPVGIVSNTYTLAQHTEVARKCLQGIQASGTETET